MGDTLTVIVRSQQYYKKIRDDPEKSLYYLPLCTPEAKGHPNAIPRAGGVRRKPLNLAPHLQSVDTMQPVELTTDLTEFDLKYYGWRVVLAACLGVMAGFGSLFVYTFTVFVKPLGAAFGWNRESVSLGFAIAALTVGLSSPLIGRLIDRFGPRRIILPCMTVFGFGVVSLAFLGSRLWQFYLTCLVIGVVGNGAAHLAYARSISTWFQRRLGMSLAFVMVGAALGAMVLPVVAQSGVT